MDRSVRDALYGDIARWINGLRHEPWEKWRIRVKMKDDSRLIDFGFGLGKMVGMKCQISIGSICVGDGEMMKMNGKMTGKMSAWKNMNGKNGLTGNMNGKNGSLRGKMNGIGLLGMKWNVYGEIEIGVKMNGKNGSLTDKMSGWLRSGLSDGYLPEKNGY